jgi:alpha-tubulin suppressor-like RCC1 family protein
VAPGQVCRPTFAKVTAGTGFACGLDEAGALWCWGGNTHHQIDAGDRLQYPLAARIDSGRAWEAIDAGGEHVCGIAAGQLYCWGRNDRGQVAPISGDVATPFQISAADGPATWTAVSAGEVSTCAIGDGRLYCWGDNNNGVLGVGSSDGTVTEPTPVKTALADWTAVDIGSNHACAVSAGSGVFCWGNASNGRIGPNAAGNQNMPVLALAPPATAVAVSESATCAITGDGGPLCWGYNGDGELGPSNAALVESATPVAATTTVGGFSAVTASESEFCGLAGDAVYCWGGARMGGLGGGVWSESKRFGKVLAGARAISLGWNRDFDVSGNDRKELDLACALVGSDAQCWGDNRYGQLGRGAATMAPAPAEVAGEHTWAQLAVGSSHACGIDTGALYCWGSTVNGQTIGMITGSSSPRTPCMPTLDCDLGTPKPIGFVADPIGIAAGNAHTCALHDDLITCWGANNNGQLGTSAAAPFKRDVPQPGGRPWASLIPTGREGQCASPGGAEVWCWGAVITQRSMPLREISLDGIRALGVGASMTCALDATGTLKCAGTNDQGQFGNGKFPGSCGDGVCSGETSSTCPADCGPGPLTTTTRKYAALAVSSTRAFACGLAGDVVECWGANNRGQTGAIDLGTNALIDPTFTPNKVFGLAGCTAVTAGDQHACAICDGKIRCWGDASGGALGAGELTRDPVPVPRTIDLVLDGDPWVELYSGQRFSCARSEAGHVYCWGSDPHAGLGNGATSANLPVTVLASPVR